MSEFGYIPESPEQSPFNNKGIFTPKDIYDLDSLDKWTPQLGQLELIQTQTVDDADHSEEINAVDFTSLGDYNVHFLTYNNLQLQGYGYPALRFYESGVLESSSVYEYAYQEGISSNSFSQVKSTGDDYLRMGLNFYQNGNGYIYLYDLLNSAKYSFCTFHTSAVNGNNLHNQSSFGGGVMPQASAVSGIRFQSDPAQYMGAVEISLYGIKDY
tara:strand:+ start:386 stop:1024 length:639 start_codon:yes stop_codon:yes gene_type:complete